MSDELFLIVKKAIQGSKKVKELLFQKELYKILVEMGEVVIKYVEGRLLQEGFLNAS